MFPTLLVVRGVANGSAEATTLEPGRTVAEELMRLYPDGFNRPFDIYLREVRDENLIPKSAHETEQIIEGERYVLVVRMGAVAIPFLISMVISIAVSVIVKALTPKPKVAESNRESEAMSPNNALAGQTNTLRPGARVPDILGRMRCWPDLIANAQEIWNGREQRIIEWFVLGVGRYDIQHARLGETAISGISRSKLIQYDPGRTVPAIMCVKRSPLVDNLSLLTESSTAEGSNTVFSPPSTMSSDVFIPISLGIGGRRVVRIGNTTYNNALFDVSGVPRSDQAAGPYQYTLTGPIRAETAANAIVHPLPEILIDQYSPMTWISSGGGDMFMPFGASWMPAVGNIVRFWFMRGANYVGRVVATQTEGAGVRFWVNDFNGNRLVMPPNPDPQWEPNVVVYEDTGDIYTGLAGVLPRQGEIISHERAESILGRADQLYTVWTDWQTAPLANPDRLFLDISFPQGLVWFNKGDRRPYTVQVQAEFRRLDQTSAPYPWSKSYTASTQSPLRYTEEFRVPSLGLPAGSPYIQVRVKRVTAWKSDDNENQYISDTRWQSFTAGTNVPARSYGNVTLLNLELWNTRAAASIGETSFNVVATRMLPTWVASGWMQQVATERWADALVSRMKATDGANKADADIDLAGIYAIQRALDAQDGGDQGKIALTLDQMQDIDAELQTIASIARCQLYRVGPKLYVDRDQGGKSPLALFTGRSKHPDAETVSVSLASEAENDAVIVPWWDRRNDAWKQREYQWPEAEVVTAINPLRIAPAQATWAQAYRRARYEWNRLTKRRETLSVKATEEASLVHPGDVINITDDVGNLSQTAGEVYEVRDLDLQLDQELDLTRGSWVILLRSLDGRATDTIPIIVSSVVSRVVRLTRAPRFTIKGRDDALGTMFAIYEVERAVVIPWLVTSIEPEERYVTINATNWTEAVFEADPPAVLKEMPVIPYIAMLVEPFPLDAYAREHYDERPYTAAQEAT